MKKGTGQVSVSLNIGSLKENKAEQKAVKYPEDEIDMSNVFFKIKDDY